MENLKKKTSDQALICLKCIIHVAPDDRRMEIAHNQTNMGKEWSKVCLIFLNQPFSTFLKISAG